MSSFVLSFGLALTLSVILRNHRQSIYDVSTQLRHPVSALTLAGYAILVAEAFEALPDEVRPHITPICTVIRDVRRAHSPNTGQAHLVGALVDSQGPLRHQSLRELGVLGSMHPADARHLAEYCA